MKLHTLSWSCFMHSMSICFSLHRRTQHNQSPIEHCTFVHVRTFVERQICIEYRSSGLYYQLQGSC